MSDYVQATEENAPTVCAIQRAFDCLPEMRGLMLSFQVWTKLYEEMKMLTNDLPITDQKYESPNILCCGIPIFRERE